MGRILTRKMMTENRYTLFPLGHSLLSARAPGSEIASNA
jgi:hypothetical protein